MNEWCATLIHVDNVSLKFLSNFFLYELGANTRRRPDDRRTDRETGRNESSLMVGRIVRL